jgi:hypothetical protein
MALKAGGFDFTDELVPAGANWAHTVGSIDQKYKLAEMTLSDRMVLFESKANT